jgi:hypothetical protein
VRTLTAGSLNLWVVLAQFKRGVESGRFLPPELRAEIKQKVELTLQEKEILKKVRSVVTSVEDPDQDRLVDTSKSNKQKNFF